MTLSSLIQIGKIVGLLSSGGLSNAGSEVFSKNAEEKPLLAIAPDPFASPCSFQKIEPPQLLRQRDKVTYRLSDSTPRKWSNEVSVRLFEQRLLKRGLYSFWEVRTDLVESLKKRGRPQNFSCSWYGRCLAIKRRRRFDPQIYRENALHYLGPENFSGQKPSTFLYSRAQRVFQKVGLTVDGGLSLPMTRLPSASQTFLNFGARLRAYFFKSYCCWTAHLHSRRLLSRGHALYTYLIAMQILPCLPCSVDLIFFEGLFNSSEAIQALIGGLQKIDGQGELSQLNLRTFGHSIIRSWLPLDWALCSRVQIKIKIRLDKQIWSNLLSPARFLKEAAKTPWWIKENDDISLLRRSFGENILFPEQQCVKK